MKHSIMKIVTLLLVIAAVFALTVPVLAGVPNAAEPQACSHPGTYTKIEISYSPKDNDNHYVITTTKHLCTNCGETVRSETDNKSTEAHDRENANWLRSDHTGSYHQHTYTYGGTCKLCGAYHTWSIRTGCTKDICVDPQSVLPEIM